MKTLEITLVRSAIGILPNQRKTLEALGLHKRLETVVKGDTPTIRGMIKVVEHLVTVSER